MDHLKDIVIRPSTNLLCGVRRYNQLLKQKAQLEELEKVLKAEQEKMLSENQRHQATAAEYHKLKEENDKWVNSVSASPSVTAARVFLNFFFFFSKRKTTRLIMRKTFNNIASVMCGICFLNQKSI